MRGGQRGPGWSATHAYVAAPALSARGWSAATLSPNATPYPIWLSYMPEYRVLRALLVAWRLQPGHNRTLGKYASSSRGAASDQRPQ